MKKTILIVSLLVVGAAAMLAVVFVFKLNFSGGNIFSPETNKPAGYTAATNTAGLSLDMKKWVWVEAKTSAGKTVRPKKDVFTLTFGKDGAVGVGTDCNSMGGRYEAKDGVLGFSEMVSTMMYCDGSQESQFTDLLLKTSGYYFTDKGGLVLTLKNNGTMLFR